jgi:hypothetical protein
VTGGWCSGVGDLLVMEIDLSSYVARAYWVSGIAKEKDDHTT